MFNLGCFDLDIDDDFSSNIFSKVVNSQSKETVEKEGALQDINLSNRNTSKCDTNIVHNVLHEQTNLESSTGANNVRDVPRIRESRENTLKRPCVQYEKVQKKRLSNEGLLQRKFPGPAGLLPDKPFRDISSLAIPVEKTKNEKEDERDMEKPIVYSQSSGSAFEELSYQKLLSDFNLNESKNPLNRYTVEWLKKTALSKGLQGRKIPFLGLVVHCVNHTMPDPVVVLRDPTGEIHGSLHREVWADMGGKLKAGIALALRQVGVLITGVIRRQIYLNITMNNILALYSPSESENQVEITTVNKISRSELLESFEQWLAQPPRAAAPKASWSAPLFATVSDTESPYPKKDEIVNLKGKVENSPARSKEKRVVEGGRNTEEVLANLGVAFTDCDFNEEMRVGVEPASGDGEAPSRGKDPGRGLSQAESLIFEEVLSGINLDEFEM